VKNIKKNKDEQNQEELFSKRVRAIKVEEKEEEEEEKQKNE